MPTNRNGAKKNFQKNFILAVTARSILVYRAPISKYGNVTFLEMYFDRN